MRLAEASPIPVLWLDLQGRVMYCNSAWYRQVGYVRSACRGRSIADFVALEGATRFHISTLLPAGTAAVTVPALEVLTCVGQREWYGYSAHLQGNRVWVYLEPIGARRALAAADRRLEQERLKQQFYACVTHELGSAVHGVNGMAELLLQEGLGVDARRYAEILGRGGRHLASLCRDLLEYAATQAPQFELKPARLDLEEELRSTLAAFGDRARDKNVMLRADFSGLPGSVIADGTRIHQIFANLIHNALKFTERGYISVKAACVRVIDERCYELRCQVEDTGCGIPPEQIGRLFTPFWRGDRSGGTGLGLAICAELVRRMGGRIEVGSEVGIGSTVTFTLQAGIPRS